MSLNGQLELSLNEEKRLGFVSLRVKNSPQGTYQLTARITNEKDKRNCKNWKCYVTISKSCVTCGRGYEAKEQRQVTLTNDAPSRDFSIRTSRVQGRSASRMSCHHDNFKFLLLVFFHVDSVPKYDPGAKYEDKKTRFTDEAEAKKLNANCKIRCEDSEEPVFVNRELLSVYSEVFSVMFNGDFIEKNAEEIKLGVNRVDLLSFLECLYSPSTPITWDNFKAVVIVADRYDCPIVIQNCKTFAEEEAKTMQTVEECIDLIEIAEHLVGWQDVMTAAVHVDFIVDLLDWEWMKARKKSTVNLLFTRMKSLLPFMAKSYCSLRSYTSMFVPTTSRFTNEDEAKKLDANCEIYFEDVEEPVFVNRELLAVYSTGFRAMFRGDLKNAEKISLNVKREDFLSFLDCLYFPTVPVTAHNFLAVTKIAKCYECPQVLEKCKEFTEKEASRAATIEDCKDYIEVADLLDWADLAVIKNMKKKGVSFFMELLKDDWIDQRKPSTQQALYEGLIEVVMLYV